MMRFLVLAAACVGLYMLWLALMMPYVPDREFPRSRVATPVYIPRWTVVPATPVTVQATPDGSYLVAQVSYAAWAKLSVQGCVPTETPSANMMIPEREMMSYGRFPDAC
jgi:hypothetical protein